MPTFAGPDPYLIKSDHGLGEPPCQVASQSVQPFGYKSRVRPTSQPINQPCSYDDVNLHSLSVACTQKYSIVMTMKNRHVDKIYGIQ